MKRVLIITYYWPPMGGSGVQRWVKFSKYLPSEGWQPVVYTPENPDLTVTDKSLLAEIPKEAEIIKRHITEPYGIYRKLTGAGKDGGEVNPIHGGPKTFKQKASLFIRGNFFRPSGRHDRDHWPATFNASDRAEASRGDGNPVDCGFP